MKIEVTINCPELIESLNNLTRNLEGRAEEFKDDITIDKVREKLLEVSKLGYEDYVKDLIKSFGVIKLTDINPKYYNEILQKVKILN